MLHRSGFPGRAALGLLLVATILRLGTNLSRVDELNPEELYRGALARALVLGAPVWPGAAPQVEHLRGSLLVSVLAVPLFALLGPTTFALRQSGLLFHLAGLLLFMRLAQRLFGRRAAVLAGALFALAPPALAKIAALAYGDHVESVPFLCAAALAVLAWLETPARAATTRRALVAGFLMGLAMSWHAQARLGALVLLATCVIAAPRRLLQREGWLGLWPGLLAGLLPMAALDAWTARAGWLVFGSNPLLQALDQTGFERAAKWWRLWTADLPAALQFPWTAAGATLCALAAIASTWLAASAWCARRERREAIRAALTPAAPAAPATALPEATVVPAALTARRAARARFAVIVGFLVGYPAVFSLAYAFGRFSINPNTDTAIQARFVLPVIPFVVLLPLAVAGARAWEARRPAWSALFVGPALLLGTAGSLSTWDFDAMRHEPARRGVHWDSYERHFQWGSMSDDDRAALRRLELAHYGDPGQRAIAERFVAEHADPARFVALVERFDDLPAWTAPLRYRLPGLVRPVTVRALEVMSPSLRGWVAATVGLDAGALLDPAARVDDLDRLRDAWTEDERVLLSRGFGCGLCAAQRPRQLDLRFVAARLAAPPPGVEALQAAFGFGASTGAMVHAFYPSGDRLVAGFVEQVDPALHAAFARGLGAGYRWRLVDPPDDTLRSPALARLLSLLPAERASDALAGLHDGEWSGPDRAR